MTFVEFPDEHLSSPSDSHLCVIAFVVISFVIIAIVFFIRTSPVRLPVVPSAPYEENFVHDNVLFLYLVVSVRVCAAV